MLVQFMSPSGEIYLEVPDHATGQIETFGLGQYELHLQSLMSQLIHKRMRVLDIGANFGAHTVLLSKLASQVVAIEANPIAFEYLKTNIALNGCSNVTAHNVAIWSHRDTLKFCYTEKEYGGGSFVMPNTQQMSLPVLPLSEVVDSAFDAVKIDVEGAELHVLRGGSKIFEQHPMLFIEAHAATLAKSGHKPLDLLYQILSFGYDRGHVMDWDAMRWVEIVPHKFQDFFTRYDMYDLVFTPNDFLLT